MSLLLSCDLLALEPAAPRSTLPGISHVGALGQPRKLTTASSSQRHLGSHGVCPFHCAQSRQENRSSELRWIPFQLSQWEQGWCPALDIGLDFKDLIQFPGMLQISSVVLDKVFHVVSSYSQPLIYLQARYLENKASHSLIFSFTRIGSNNTEL